MNLYDILMSEDVVETIENNLDILLQLIPEIKDMIGFEHRHPAHIYDVWEHTLYALKLSPKDFDTRLALLLHDIGKPFSYSEDGNIRHYYNHPQVSASMAFTILNRLGFDNSYIEKICFLVRNHDNRITNSLVNDCYDWCLILYDVQCCDAFAHNPENLESRKTYLEKTHKLIYKESD